MPSSVAIHSPATATRSGATVTTDTVGGVGGVAADAFWSRQPAADAPAAAMISPRKSLFMGVTRFGGGWVRPHLKAPDG